MTIGLRWAVTVATLLCATALLLRAAPPAAAGTYVINNCSAAQAGNTDVGPWVPDGSVPAPGAFKQTCTSAGDYFGAFGPIQSTNTNLGEQLTSPPGITIRHLRLWWYAPAPMSGWGYGMIFANGIIVGQAADPTDYRSPNPSEVSLPSNTSRLEVINYCTTSRDCQYSQQSIIQLFGSQLTLSSDLPPSANVTGGGLAGGGPISGTRSMSYDAADPRSGVRRVELLVDGIAVSQNDYLGRCPYSNFAACPTSISDLLSWDTATASNGAHDVLLRITNAAGVTTLIDDHTVVVDNPASGDAGGLPSGERGPLNGDHASDGARLLRLALRRSGVRFGAGRGILVRGRLTDEHVHGIGGASIEVLRELRGRTGFELLGHVRTAADGGYSYVIRPGASGVVRLGYRSHLRDGRFAAFNDIPVRVPAGARLTIRPRRVQNGQRISFHGRLAGGFIPASGEYVEIQVLIGAAWRDVMAAHAGSGGRFSAGYRFARTTIPVTYTFRAAIRPDAGYPFEPGSSNVVSVRVN